MIKPDVIVKIGTEPYTTQVTIANHNLIADEPEELGGQDEGPTPSSYFLTSLGTCKAITMRMYANLKKWPLEEIELSLSMEEIKNSGEQQTTIQVNIKLIGNLDDLQRERLLKIAEKCPIHKIMNNPILIETNIIQ